MNLNWIKETNVGQIFMNQIFGKKYWPQIYTKLILIKYNNN